MNLCARCGETIRCIVGRGLVGFLRQCSGSHAISLLARIQAPKTIGLSVCASIQPRQLARVERVYACSGGEGGVSVANGPGWAPYSTYIPTIHAVVNGYPVVSYSRSQHLPALLCNDVLHVHQRYFLLRYGDCSSGPYRHRRRSQARSVMEKVQEDGRFHVESASGRHFLPSCSRPYHWPFDCADLWYVVCATSR